MEPPLDLDQRRVDWIANLGPTGGGAFVALDGEQIVGEASLWPAQAGALVLGTVIADGWRRRSVGSQLLAAAMFAAQARKGIRRVDLAVFPHNTAALALYRKHGFIETALEPEMIPRQSGELWDLILMRREFS